MKDENETKNIDDITVNNEAESVGINDPLYPEVEKFVLKTGRLSIALIQSHFKIDFNRAANILEQIELNRNIKHLEAPSKKEIDINCKNKIKDTKKISEEILFYVSILVFFLVGISTYIYFKDSLWTIVNIIVSAIIAICISGAISFLLLPSDNLLKDIGKNNSIFGMILICIAILAFSVTRGCFYVSPEEIAERAELARLEQQMREKRAIQAKELEEKEAADFLNSNEEIKIYGTVANNDFALTRAKKAIKIFAHDPDSVTDVSAITNPVRIRIKQYPQCRYAIEVQFRAKNAFGALVKQTGVVLFDKDWYGFQVLEKRFF